MTLVIALSIQREAPVSEPQLVEVYRAKNAHQAHALRLALEEAGFFVHIDGDQLQGAGGELPLGWITAPRIMVDASQCSKARELIDRIELQRRDSVSDEAIDDSENEPNRCLACGHEMKETDLRCSECGWTFLHQQSVDSEDDS